MEAFEPIHPTLNDLKFEVGQVLICWSFLENTMRRQLSEAGLQKQILKGPVITHWRNYIKVTHPDRSEELLAPIEKVARIRNLLAHSIHALTADPWTANSAVIVCAPPEGRSLSFSIEDLRATSVELGRLMVTPIRLLEHC